MPTQVVDMSSGHSDIDAVKAKVDTLHDTRLPGVVQPQTGDSFARLGAPAGVSVSADVAAVKAQTAAIEGFVDALETRVPGVVQPQTGDSFARLGAPVGASLSVDLQNHWNVEAASPVADATVGSTAEENLLDKGADAGVPRYRLDAALCNVVAMGANTQITFRLKAEINGTLRQIGNDVQRSAAGAFDLLSLLGVNGGIASRHVRVTVVGNNAANGGSVDATFITSKAG